MTRMTFKNKNLALDIIIKRFNIIYSTTNISTKINNEEVKILSVLYLEDSDSTTIFFNDLLTIKEELNSIGIDVYDININTNDDHDLLISFTLMQLKTN